MTIRSLINRPESMLQLAGISSLLAGSLFFPLFPWYMLGQVKEAEIGLWGLLSMIGGAVSIAGAAALRITGSQVQRILLLISLVGMVLIILAQAPAVLMWLFYGGEFTHRWAPSKPIGMIAGLALHTWICMAAAGSIVAAGRALAGAIEQQPQLRLSRKGWLSFAAVLMLVVGALWGWEQYQNRHWLVSIYPADGAVNVPRNATVSAVWKGQYDSMGMRIDYADDPHEPTPGVTSGTPYGISFTPEKPFLPGRQIKVTVEAGRRTRTITFTTAEE